MNNETLEKRTTATPINAASASIYGPTAPRPIIELKNILVPLDLSETSLKSLQYAVPFAKQFGATLTLLHVVHPAEDAVHLGYPAAFGAEHFAVLEKRLQDIRATKIPTDLPANVVLRYNFAFDGILEVAREIRADLIIATTHGYTGLKHLMMGSTAENIVRRAPCPVLVVREIEHDFCEPVPQETCS